MKPDTGGEATGNSWRELNRHLKGGANYFSIGYVTNAYPGSIAMFRNA